MLNLLVSLAATSDEFGSFQSLSYIQIRRRFIKNVDLSLLSHSKTNSKTLKFSTRKILDLSVK